MTQSFSTTLHATTSFLKQMQECQSHAGMAVSALAEGGDKDSALFSEMCALREQIDQFVERLNPSISLERDTPVAAPGAGVTPDQRS